MKKTIQASIALLLLATTSFPVLAEPAPRDPHGHVRFAPGPGAGVEYILRHSERLDLTSEQEKLLDAVRSTLAPLGDVLERSLDERPSIVDRLENRISAMRIQADVIESALPSIQAFLDSLTDEQRAELEPKPRENRKDRHERGGDRDHRSEQSKP